MKRSVILELYSKHDRVNFYTFRYVDEADADTEIIKFLDSFDKAAFEEDVDIIVEWIYKIGEDGAHDRYFRPEKGNMMALPIETSKLRLFCFKPSDGIVILGNGGEKTTQTYNEDPILNAHAENILSIGKILCSLIKKDKVLIYNNELYQLNPITFEAI